MAIPIHRETPRFVSAARKNQPQIFADDHRSELRKVKRLRAVNSYPCYPRKSAAVSYLRET